MAAALLKQEVKGTVQRKDVPAMHSGTATNFKPGKEVHFTSGLSSSVHLRGYMTRLRADVSSCNSSGQRPVTTHLTAVCVTKSL